MSEMQEQSNLMLGDRINWTYILGLTTVKFHEVDVRDEGLKSEKEVLEAAKIIWKSIPDAWLIEDENFKADLEKAKRTRKIDVRKEFCGVKVGEPVYQEEKYFDALDLYHACVNAFNNCHLLTKTIFQEQMIPTPEDFEE